MLGLRSLFFVLSSLMARFRYLKPALAVVLGFVGLKMILEEWIRVPVWLSLDRSSSGCCCSPSWPPGGSAGTGPSPEQNGPQPTRKPQVSAMTVAPRAGASHGAGGHVQHRHRGHPDHRQAELLGRAQRSGEWPVRLHLHGARSPTRAPHGAQLRSRHWVITDANGHVEEVKGEGVVGKTPQLGPGERFEYTSWAMLRTPFGTMRGSYTFVRPDGTSFQARIAEFALTKPNALN